MRLIDAMLTENEPVASEEDSLEEDGQVVDSEPPDGNREESIQPGEGKQEVGSKRRGRKTKRKEKQAPEEKETTIFDVAARRFQVCGRCSTFLAECRAKLSPELLQTALELSEQQKEWVVFPWGPDVYSFMAKAYATPDDHEYYYYDSHCPDCGRRIVYHIHPIQNIPPSIRLHL